MVKRPARGAQVWSMEKLENKLVDMRDMYDEWRRRQRDDVIENVSFIRNYPHGTDILFYFILLLTFTIYLLVMLNLQRKIVGLKNVLNLI